MRKSCCLYLVLICAAIASISVPALAQSTDEIRLLHQIRRLQLQGEDLQAAIRSKSADSEVSQSGSISGRVYGLSNRALESAQVVAWTVDSTGETHWKGAAKVNRDSTYRIEGLVEGAYYVMASADGYLTLFFDNVLDMSDATTVEVTDSSSAAEVDFRMKASTPGTGAISGSVLAQEDGDPIAAAEVYAYAPDNPLLYAYTWTADDGTYVLSELKSGRYIVEVRSGDFISEYYDNAEDYAHATLVEVHEPNWSEGIDFELSLGGSITGYVMDEGGAPIAGAFIEALVPVSSDSTGQEDPVVWPWQGGWAVSDESGFYRITGLRSGDYVLYAQAWSHWSVEFEWFDDAKSVDEATRVPVSTGLETSGIDFRLNHGSSASSISGIVRDEQGKPIADAFLMAQSSSDRSRADGYVWAHATTDRDGRYVIEQLPEGSYSVSASAQLGWLYMQRWYPDAEHPDAATPVLVGDDERVENIDFRLPASAGGSSISGVARSKSGEVLAGVFVEVSSNASRGDDTGSWMWAYGVSDSSGGYEIQSLPEGSYIVHASYWSDEQFGQAWYDGASGPEGATPVSLNNDEDLSGIDFELDVRPIYGKVEGTITDEADGLPQERVYVELSPVGRNLFTDAPLWSMSTYALTDEKGRFTLDRVTEGTYVLSVYANGAAEHYDNAATTDSATELHIIGGSETFVDIALSPVNNGEGAISGSILGEDGSPPAIAVAVAQPVRDDISKGVNERYTAVTAPDGSYRISGLPAGAYYVSTFAPGYVGEFYDDVYTPEEASRVEVDGLTTTAAVDFRLWQYYYLAPETDAGRAASVFYGKVLDESGKPVAGATVYLLDASEQPVASVLTGPDGAFEIAGIQPGQYRLFAGKVGFSGGYNGKAVNFTEAQPLPAGGGRIQVDLVVSSGASTVTEDAPSIPKRIELLGNYPNPFNPETAIQVRIGEPSNVRIVVFDVLGSEVAVLVDRQMGSGVQTFRWNGRSTSGRDAASGIYFYRVESGGEARTGRMMLLR